MPLPGQERRSAAVALTAAELALSGIRQLIPFDEMLAAMYRVGRQMSPDPRETALADVRPRPLGRRWGAGHVHAVRNYANCPILWNPWNTGLPV